MEARAPFLHPRLEVRDRGTWASAGGGDRDGNCRGSASGAERRLERIREGYREGVPRSRLNPPPAGGAAPPVAARNDLRGRLSRWLEDDGWMPRRLTADLAGNLVSVSKVGFEDAAADAEGVEPSGETPSFQGVFPLVGVVSPGWGECLG